MASHLLRRGNPNWSDLRREQDYYFEGLLIWLEADAIIRDRSQGKHSLDDFCRKFLGKNPSTAKVVPYELPEIVKDLRELADFDWEPFLTQRVTQPQEALPLDVVGRCGYRLQYATQPSAYLTHHERGSITARDSLGLIFNGDGSIVTVIPGMIGDRAGLAPGMKVIGVNNKTFSRQRLLDALADSVAVRKIELLLIEGERFRTIVLNYADGPRYLELVRDESKPDILAEILKPRAKPSTLIDTNDVSTIPLLRACSIKRWPDRPIFHDEDCGDKIAIDASEPVDDARFRSDGGGPGGDRFLGEAGETGQGPAPAVKAPSFPAPKGYVCYRAITPIQIDGRLDDEAWKAAPWTDAFVDIQGDVRPRPRFQTQAKMLWDDTYFYVGALLEEPHVWGTLTKHDSVIFQDNDFEIFIDPDGDNQEYYEIEINALNTEWDLFLKKAYRDGGPAINEWEIPGLKTAVHVSGTLNNLKDTDQSWSVEFAIPWKVLAEFAHRPSPPKDGDQWRVNFSRVEWQHQIVGGKYRKVPNTPEDNWVWSPQGAIDMHRPERWGYVQFSTAPAGQAAYRPDPAGPIPRSTHADLSRSENLSREEQAMGREY